MFTSYFVTPEILTTRDIYYSLLSPLYAFLLSRGLPPWFRKLEAFGLRDILYILYSNLYECNLLDEKPNLNDKIT